MGNDVGTSLCDTKPSSTGQSHDEDNLLEDWSQNHDYSFLSSGRINNAQKEHSQVL
jgi:hypothetical protein